MNDSAEEAPDQAAASILLVDDEEDILPEYQEFLELEGFSAAICSDPERAVQMVLEQPSIGLVITDLQMARLDGMSLIRQLRTALPSGRHVEFIILTGDATSLISDASADIPVFIKPPDTDALVAAITSALARTQ